ncbi:MAG: hypothetical protein LBS59_04580 [Puniceicoccales bacterium]|jgi:hypothetical protein|nr:hypothetical protein [Puniceicoccales bacterium]
MPPNAEKIRCLVLAREPSGEHFLKLALLSPQNGIMTCLLRLSALSKNAHAPDFFDVADITLAASKKADAPAQFIAEYTVLRRHSAIGSDYTRLAIASRLSLIILKNPLPPESTKTIAALLDRATDALANKPLPHVTFFKTLWELARNEGYPVREHWLASLPPDRRQHTLQILRQPLDNQDTPPNNLADLTHSLEQWLSRECHFVIPQR